MPGRIRIISGIWKGRLLEVPKGKGTRPMLERAREAVFSIIGDSIRGMTVWDLFAGSGSLGLEALSRGAEKAWFVERDRNAILVLRKNIEYCAGEDGGEKARILQGNAWYPPRGEPDDPDLVFLDPPFKDVLGNEAFAMDRLEALAGTLKEGGCIVFHLKRGSRMESMLEACRGVTTRKYGNQSIAFVWKEDFN